MFGRMTFKKLMFGTKGGSSAILAGKFLSSSGSPIAGARVVLNTGQVNYTQSDGSFSFVLPFGKYCIIPVASQFWVYNPCYLAVNLIADSINNNFIATESNKLI